MLTELPVCYWLKALTVTFIMLALTFVVCGGKTKANSRKALVFRS
jgi:hypothetical protein